MTAPIHLISSMATKQLLADLADLYQRNSSQPVRVESVGGVNATQRVQAGEAFDGVVLAADAIDRLIGAGHIVAGSRADLVRSGVAVAVRAGASRPDISSEAALKRAVLAAKSVGYSTGPSGVHLAQLFERWGLAEALRARTVQAPPGVPVGTLVAEGRIELGFQQLSELMNLPGIEVLGPLPPGTQIVTTFSAGVAAASQQPDAVRALLAFMTSPATLPAKHANGMQPAD
jgi:molybdate transport system substrate-binding protein